MLNEKSLYTISTQITENEFIKPLYQSYCFSNISGTLLKLFKQETKKKGLPKDCIAELNPDCKKVILFIIDAFGWDLLQRNMQQPRTHSLKQWEEAGMLSKITSSFPSTTAVCMTELYSGVPTISSGVIEWFYYDGQVGEIINPFGFSLYSDEKLNCLSDQGFTPNQLLPTSALASSLNEIEVPWYAYMPDSYLKSKYNEAVLSGSKLVSILDRKESLNNFITNILNTPGPGLFTFYLPDIDEASHKFGPQSTVVNTITSNIIADINSTINYLKSKGTKATVLLTADHGQIEVDPAKTIYIDREVPELAPMLKRTKSGKITMPSGSPRDLFFHVQKDFIQEAKSLLTCKLANRAMVYLVQDLLDSEMFGLGKPSQQFINNIGQLAVIPLVNNTVYWLGDQHDFLTFKGYHGGLSKYEMETFFLCLNL